jgi:hypothetical protein
MPIRINLLAEAQAAEELRRRDPIKRVIYVGMLLVALMLVWWSWLQLRVMVAHSTLSQIEGQIDSRTNAYEAVLVSQKKIAQTKQSLAALHKLTEDRFLQGDLLNALQKATVPGVKLMRLIVDQSYVAIAPTDPQTADGQSAPSSPGSVTEKIVVTLDAVDSSSNPGDAVNKFKDAISERPYFQDMLDKTNGVRLTNLSPPQIGVDGKPSVLFTLQCTYPEHTR